MIAHAIGIALGLATYALEGGRLDNGKLPATGFDYVATSGEVETGQGVTFPWSALKFGGQEYHIDGFNALQSELLYLYYTNQLPKINAWELLRWGYQFDMPMTDSGRPLNMLIPHPDKEKTFQAFTAYNSYACISVRSMILMHKGHDGACGNTVWHGAIIPKREDSLAFFDEDKLGYLPLSSRRAFRVQGLQGSVGEAMDERCLPVDDFCNYKRENNGHQVFGPRLCYLERQCAGGWK
jgi:hypothetical protein